MRPMSEWDDPDEYWYKCKECDATGEVAIVDDDGTLVDWAKCPDCDGHCVIEGDEDDQYTGWERVPSNWQP